MYLLAPRWSLNYTDILELSSDSLHAMLPTLAGLKLSSLWHELATEAQLAFLLHCRFQTSASKLVDTDEYWQLEARKGSWDTGCGNGCQVMTTRQCAVHPISTSCACRKKLFVLLRCACYCSPLLLLFFGFLPFIGALPLAPCLSCKSTCLSY